MHGYSNTQIFFSINIVSIFPLPYDFLSNVLSPNSLYFKDTVYNTCMCVCMYIYTERELSTHTHIYDIQNMLIDCLCY